MDELKNSLKFHAFWNSRYIDRECNLKAFQTSTEENIEQIKKLFLYINNKLKLFMNKLQGVPKTRDLRTTCEPLTNSLARIRGPSMDRYAYFKVPLDQKNL